MPLDTEKVERLRIGVGLTQAAIARKVGITRQRWNDIVSGRSSNISIKTLDRISRSLRVESGDLLIRRITSS